jgi:hypothetical protein
MKAILTVAVLAVVPCLAQEARPIYESPRYAVFADRVVEGDKFARAVSRTEIESNYTGAAPDGKPVRWKLTADVSRFPRFQSGALLIDALYNMALEEMQKDIRPDGAFMAGAQWDGVWTRDVSYSILLSLAAIAPEAAKTSLLMKVKRGRIVQDTGTGGSWPVSSDRMTWALAAWEIYQVTGDRQWLGQSFRIIRDSMDDDRHVVFSRETGLVLGESSFLDWREQTYPRWMDPADIYSAQALGTNAVHYRTCRILAAMARRLGQPSAPYADAARRIRDAVNQRLWIAERGYFGQYLYGRSYMSLSPRPEALGEALAVLFDIPGEERQDAILRSVPVVEYGIPCVYPQTPGIPPYHNDAVWPFVQAFWNLAAAKRHNGAALAGGLASIYRAAGLFLTDKENLVASTGSYSGTAINSDRQLWSVAGNLAMAYRVLAGMEFTPEGIRLHPVIPAALDGVKALENFRYRKAQLSLRVEGHGSRIRSVTLDGRPSRAWIPGSLVGRHEVRIVMAGDALGGRANLVPLAWAPETPALVMNGATLTWGAVEGASEYRVYRNGRRIGSTAKTSFDLPRGEGYSEYQVSASGASGLESFLSEPVVAGAKAIVVPAAASGAVELDRTRNTRVVLRASVPAAGRYRVSFRYANGSGPINTDNKCAIRTLWVDGRSTGPIVLPQRGANDWTSTGASSGQTVALTAGEHTFDLRFEPHDENMNPEVNRALLHALELVRLE